jgi:4-amino-4-deoxy-L-arabinose transferase-like glycosyltransferase
MAEPTTTTASVGWAVAAGTLGAFFAAIGVSWVAVFWALMGGLIGVSFAPQTGRLRAMLMFPTSALLAAKAGTLGAVQFFAASSDWSGGLAAVSGIVLHPVISATVQAIPAIISARLGGQQQDNR